MPVGLKDQKVNLKCKVKRNSLTCYFFFFDRVIMFLGSDMMAKVGKKKNKNKVILIVTLVLIGLALLLGAFLVQKLSHKKQNNIESNSNEEVKEEAPKPQLKIINPDSNSRNIAVMYNNISTVWGYQSGLEDAYLVYEMLVEGGYTRLMAIFKDKKLDRIGSIRSSRPYFLDFALENDALYVHFGASDQALSDIKKLDVNNINLMNYNAGYWRDRSLGLAMEHTAFTSTDRLETGFKKYGYRLTTTSKPVLNYSVDEIDLSTMPGAISATSIFIDYSASRNTSYIYDSVNKVYLRSQGTAKKSYQHIDGVTKKQYTAKNIITYKLATKTIDKKGRQQMDTFGGGSGYFITNGYAVPISWEKNSRSSKTIYRYMNGKEIEVNDGNTYIQIQPSTEELVIK